MGDAGEGLVNAEDRLQERLAESQRAGRTGKSRTPEEAERERKLNTLRLARVELERQAAATQNPVRREQIRQAVADIDRRVAET